MRKLVAYLDSELCYFLEMVCLLGLVVVESFVEKADNVFLVKICPDQSHSDWILFVLVWFFT